RTFGPVLSFGLGGIFVEVLNDIVFGICPINKKEAIKMIKKIKGHKILWGWRGQKPVDINKLADILVNVCKMAMENENIKEIDFNPAFASEKSVAVADAKIII
ncbi:MAG: acetate--CoA ligase family protein, partial [Patescibacteria group bacterium]|nr:acetate--CoA ligase family protein [Patescibacteria group bacterium]